MPFTIVRNDITQMTTDAIVNAANTALQMGGGVCGSIFAAAGAEELQRECDAIGSCATGQAVITPGYRLPARYIIHTPGPIWHGGGAGEADLLRDCYRNSLELARQHNCASIAFPLISSGIFGYPRQEALAIATATIIGFLAASDDNNMDVYLVVFDKTAFGISAQLLGDIKSFIDEQYVASHLQRRRRMLEVEKTARQRAVIPSAATSDRNVVQSPEDAYSPALFDDGARLDVLGIAPPPNSLASLHNMVTHTDESFSRTLLRLIKNKGKDEVAIYKQANISRKLFSKIRGNDAYMPKKKTVLAFAVALRLDLAETRDLLNRAGYSLSHSQKFDLIVEYFITHGHYNIFEINEVLFHYDQPLLGGV